MSKQYKSFIKAIGQYGLYAEISKKHLKIMKDGQMITSMSLTPRDQWVALDHTLRHLISDGYLPKINRRSFAHELKRAKV